MLSYGHLIDFPSFRGHNIVIPVVQNLKAVVSYILSISLAVYGRRHNLVQATSSRLEVEDC